MNSFEEPIAARSQERWPVRLVTFSPLSGTEV
jgi:hypothetical protein